MTNTAPQDGLRKPTGQQRPVVAMLLYPGFTLLDLVGPHTALVNSMDIHLVSVTLDEVMSDSGIAVRPTTTLADCPSDIDVLFVPGGVGLPGVSPVDSMSDEAVLTFLKDRAATAQYVTSVCSGALFLGAAGLLNGYRAATHWVARDVLPLFGAEPSDERVCTDRNRITGGGVTAGIDFGLTILARMLGEETAKLIQLMMEYDPQPPFDAGAPESAGPVLADRGRQMLGHLNVDIGHSAEELALRGWGRQRATSG